MDTDLENTVPRPQLAVVLVTETIWSNPTNPPLFLLQRTPYLFSIHTPSLETDILGRQASVFLVK